METTASIPARRLIEHPDGDAVKLTEEQVEKIMDAIFSGKRISRARDGRSDRETCVTRFRDPFSGAERFAVESWWAYSKATVDFSSEECALDFCRRENERLNI